MKRALSTVSAHWLSLIVSLGAFLMLAWAVSAHFPLESWDREMIRRTAESRTLFWNKFFIDFTVLGGPVLIPVFTLFSLVVLALLNLRSDFYYLLMNQGAILFWSPVLKHGFGRSRPELEFHLIPVTGLSFPSGHALSATTFYLTLILIVLPAFSRPWKRTLLTGLGFWVMIMVCFSRVYLGLHYPSDVLGGVLFGISWVSLTTLLLKRNFFGLSK